jgi:hypothetical protein
LSVTLITNDPGGEISDESHNWRYIPITLINGSRDVAYSSRGCQFWCQFVLEFGARSCSLVRFPSEQSTDSVGSCSLLQFGAVAEFGLRVSCCAGSERNLWQSQICIFAPCEYCIFVFRENPSLFLGYFHKDRR